MPGTDFFGPAMRGAYTVGSLSASPAVDYSGYSSMEMYARWQELSKTPETATKIVNLIWTDYAAAAVVGTKGVLGPGNMGFANETVPITVEPIVLRVKCRSGFAIPAFILAAMFLLVNVLAFLSWICGYSNWNIVEKRLHQSSIGRIFTTFLFPGLGDENNDDNGDDRMLPSKVWSKTLGSKDIDHSCRYPRRSTPQAIEMGSLGESGNPS